MFTFGRDKEKINALKYFSNPDKAELLLSLIDDVHDFLEFQKNSIKLKRSFELAFENGGSRVWESAGSWLLRLSVDYPSFNGVWVLLTKHKLAKVRFRVACFLDGIPRDVGRPFFEILSVDKSKKVREQAVDKWNASDYYNKVFVVE